MCPLTLLSLLRLLLEPMVRLSALLDASIKERRQRRTSRLARG